MALICAGSQLSARCHPGTQSGHKGAGKGRPRRVKKTASRMRWWSHFMAFQKLPYGGRPLSLPMSEDGAAAA